MPALRQMAVDEIHPGKTEKFLTLLSNLDCREPLWFGREGKKQTLDEFFQTELTARQGRGITAACVDYVGALPVQHPAVASELPDRIRQDSSLSTVLKPSRRLSTSFSMPTMRWIKCRGPSSSAEGCACAGW